MQPSGNVLRKRITFERTDQRADVAKKISREAEQLLVFFRKVGGDAADFDSPFKAIGAPTGSLAEVLGQTDVDMLALDIGSLVKKYPDLSQDQLLCLLNMRGDLVSFFSNIKISKIRTFSHLSGSFSPSHCHMCVRWKFQPSTHLSPNYSPVLQMRFQGCDLIG